MQQFAAGLQGFFTRGDMGLKDDERPGPSKIVTTPQTIDKVHDTVLSERRLNMKEIVMNVG